MRHLLVKYTSTYIVEEETTVNGNNHDTLSSTQSFEELLLNTMKQTEINRTQSKRKIGHGGSVITTDEAMQILKKSDEKNKEKFKQKTKNEKTSK